ncbi:response regulator transcription factor [Caenispirillum salinarum]|uniref:response regulator transcription factor n=1 Tax=Caenispirillum salinarum TaxID=859058 RepID=UPI00384C9EAA
MTDRSTIVLIDDDPLFRESLGRNLEDSGYAVETFADGPTAIEPLTRGDLAPSLILLDWKMPRMTGIEVLRQLRSSGDVTPVIFLTTLNDQLYEETALTNGAVDYVDKGRGFNILLRRINLILEGSKPVPGMPNGAENGAVGQAIEPEEILTLGPLTLDVSSARARWRDQPVDLTITEFRIVRKLAENAGRDLSYRALYDAVRGEGFIAGSGDEGYRANVRTHIKRIRQKFREIDASFDAILNYAGFGYGWRAEG